MHSHGEAPHGWLLNWKHWFISYWAESSIRTIANLSERCIVLYRRVGWYVSACTSHVSPHNIHACLYSLSILQIVDNDLIDPGRLAVPSIELCNCSLLSILLPLFTFSDHVHLWLLPLCFVYDYLSCCHCRNTILLANSKLACIYVIEVYKSSNQ